MDDPQLSEEQLAYLTRGGDCPLHFHTYDQVPTVDTLRRLQQLERVVTVTASTDLATSTEAKEVDYLRVDATSVSPTITLPYANNNGRRITVSRVLGANSVIIAAQGGETVSGTTTISSSFAPRTYKAVSELAWEEV